MEKRLVKEVASFYNSDIGWVVLGNGSASLLQSVFISLTKSGDRVLLHEQTFALYGEYAQCLGLEIGNYSKNSYTELVLQINKTKPKMVVVCQPNNPTWESLTRDDIEKLAKVCEEQNCYLVIDEAYVQFWATSSIQGTKKNTHLVVVQTFSKAWGLAGVRLWAVFANRKTIQLVQEFIPPNSLSSFAIEAWLYVLRNKNKYYRNWERIGLLKERLIAKLQNISWLGELTDGWGNFVFITTPHAKEIHAYLQGNGIFIRDFPQWWAIRISVGTKKQCQLVAELLAQYFSK